MFREMRRFKQALSKEASEAVLARGASGVLALLGDGGYPYTVPMSYAYHDGRLLFHCALAGHKLDAIAACDKASFCVVDQDQIVPEKYTTYYRSAVAFGRIRVLADEAGRRAALEVIAAKYSPEHEEGRLKEVERQLPRACILELEIEHLTGKQAMELIRPSGSAPSGSV